MFKMFLYGISGARDQYRVVGYYGFLEEDISVTDIKYQASRMRFKNPSIERMFIIDAREGLRADYTRAFKKNSIESWAIFKDILIREGLEIF